MDTTGYAANILMTHWCAQNFYHWLSFPRAQEFDPIEWDQTLKWSGTIWDQFIRHALSDADERWAWRDIYRRKVREHKVSALPLLDRFKYWTQNNPIPFHDARYPYLLRNITDHPAILFAHGELGWLNLPMVAVVGSRKASPLALQNSRRFSEIVARQGVPVASGGALGCDGVAHWGAVASGQNPVPTVVVFAGGVDQLYPRANAGLFRHVAAQGGLFISERLPGSPCRPLDFPVRNRIIAGISKAVVVMQAAVRSGALVTARLALDQGRDVWVLRHPDGDVRADGGAALIADGAPEFSDAEDLAARLIPDIQMSASDRR